MNDNKNEKKVKVIVKEMKESENGSEEMRKNNESEKKKRLRNEN